MNPGRKERDEKIKIEVDEALTGSLTSELEKAIPFGEMDCADPEI